MQYKDNFMKTKVVTFHYKYKQDNGKYKSRSLTCTVQDSNRFHEQLKNNPNVKDIKHEKTVH